MFKSKKNNGSGSEMDFKPFMNLMVVLIPMLLVSAEYAKVAVIDISLPPDKGSTAFRKTERSQNQDEKLNLTAIITDSTLTIGAKGGFLPTIAYKEYHHYIAKDGHHSFNVEYNPGVEVKHPLTGRVMKNFERNDICLYVCDANGDLENAYYTKYNELLIDNDGMVVTTLQKGDTAFVMQDRKRMVVVNNLSDYYRKPLSVYDELQKRLLTIKERYADARDNDELTIAAEDRVIYDKIIQIMDNARAAQFSNISIAKLRT